jgi:hypothetical protein
MRTHLTQNDYNKELMWVKKTISYEKKFSEERFYV